MLENAMAVLGATIFCTLFGGGFLLLSFLMGRMDEAGAALVFVPIWLGTVVSALCGAYSE